MDYFTLKSRFEKDYLLKLFRSRTPALFLSFVYREFKENHIINMQFHQAVIRLILHLEEIHFDIPENSTHEEYCQSLVENWCSEDNQLLRRYYDPSGEMYIELTSHSERGIRWMEELSPKEFVGTESRFIMIYKMLEDLVKGSNEDPKKRLKELRDERKRIDDEIKEIKESGKVATLSSFQIEERFHQVSLAARDLLSDFKEVDNNFRALVQDFYIKGLEEGSKGDLLGATLDGYRELLESPQGRSFSGFWNFLMADLGEDKISSMVQSIYEVAEKQDLDTQDKLLKNLKHYLHMSGQRILKTNHKLAEKLNRILSDPKTRENKRINSLIQDIKTQVIKTRDNPVKEKEFLSLEVQPEINMPMERPLVMPEGERDFSLPEKAEKLTFGDFSALFSFHSLEREKIENIIKESLKNRERINLSEIIMDNPIHHGLEEILTYFDIAGSDVKAEIIKEKTTLVTYTTPLGEKTIEVPEVIFCR